MTQIVKCLICGKEKEVLNNNQKSFTCCRTRQPIDERTKLNAPIEKEIILKNGTDEPKLMNVEDVKEKKEVAENQDLEIENDEPENPLENLPEEKKEFHCPNCNNQLNEYETPCPKCFYEIEWAE